jgi:[amino group carrier protein]-lysine/ornithine hydrolase
MNLIGPPDSEAALERLLLDMVQISSVSGNEHEVASALAEALPTWGFETRIDGAGNLRAKIGHGSIDGVLLGHLDTVPGDLPVMIQEGKLYGRGSVDAKGPFATFIAAAARAARASADLKLELIGCVEEELPSSKGARHVLDRNAPDFCIVGEPSGWQGITLGYKGYLAAALHFDGDGHHGAHAQQGVCERAMAAWHQVEMGAKDFGGDTLYEKLLTRLAAFSHATLPAGRERAELQIHLRLPEHLDPDAAQTWLMRKAQADHIHILGHAPAWSGPRNSPLVRAVHRAILQTGGRPRALRKTGTADMNLVAPAWACPTIAYGPGDAALDHSPGEHMVLKELHSGTAVLNRSLMALSSGSLSLSPSELG